MEKEVELFDPKFVHFMWGDSLEGKEGFGADSIELLMESVRTNDAPKKCIGKSKVLGRTFETKGGSWTFFYYDPNYEVKYAYYKECKQIQYRVKGFVDWEDYTNQNPCWDDADREWRIKPEVVWCVCETIGHGLQIMEFEDAIESAVLFKGTGEECYKWTVEREKKCSCKEGIDPKACMGCPQDSDSNEEKKRAEPTFQEELRSLLNRYGMDNECDTPDHVLRDYLASCLENYRIITKRNMLWHGWLGLGAELTEEGWKKSVESALKFLMDNRVIKSWQYNGTFHVEGNE